MTSLSAELNRFCEFSKRTKEILSDTKRCFDDINEAGNSELGKGLFWFLHDKLAIQ
jgi:hypothetical protein